MKRILAAIALAAAATFTLSACTPAEPTIQVASDTVVIDVRTPEEFAAGHLENAVNIDVQSPNFDSIVTKLPTDGAYVIYCRSGNRSAAAIVRMEALGFTNMIDAGGMEEASGATNLPIVK